MRASVLENIRQMLQSTDETDRLAVVTVVVVPIHVAVIEVQVERVVRVARVGRRRPIVAVVSNIVDIRAVAVARGGQKDRTGVGDLFATDGGRDLCEPPAAYEFNRLYV